MRITPMEERHLDALAQLEAQCFSDPWSRNGLAAELGNPNAWFTVAEAEGQVLGYAGCHHVCGEWYVDNVAVFQTCRCKGVAKALMLAMLHDAWAEDAAFVTLEVRESNAPAVALYASLGFEIVGKRKAFYSHPTEDALIMTATHRNPAE